MLLLTDQFQRNLSHKILYAAVPKVIIIIIIIIMRGNFWKVFRLTTPLEHTNNAIQPDNHPHFAVNNGSVTAISNSICKCKLC